MKSGGELSVCRLFKKDDVRLGNEGRSEEKR